MAALPGLINTVTQFQGKLGDGPQVLLQCLEAQEALQKRLTKAASYASFHQSMDGTNPTHQTMSARTRSLMANVQAATTFIQSESLSLPQGRLQEYLQAEPGLEPYRITIENRPASGSCRSKSDRISGYIRRKEVRTSY